MQLFFAGSGSHLSILYESGFGSNCTKVKSSGIFCRYATGVGAGVVFSHCLRCKEFKEADVDRPDLGLFLRGLLRILANPDPKHCSILSVHTDIA
jgi:hypothetical protein